MSYNVRKKVNEKCSYMPQYIHWEIFDHRSDLVLQIDSQPVAHSPIILRHMIAVIKTAITPVPGSSAKHALLFRRRRRLFP